MIEEFKKLFIEQELIAKKHFIEELGDLCCKYRVGDVMIMEYSYDEETGEETVTVYTLGIAGGSTTTVNVTADSLPAMVSDIFKVI